MDDLTLEQRRDAFITWNMARLIVDCITMTPPLDTLAREHLAKAPRYGIAEAAVMTYVRIACPTTHTADLRRFERLA